MEAVITAANRQRGMYAAKISNTGEFVIFELLDTSEPEIGDVIRHPDFYSMGCDYFTNLTKNCQFEACVQNCLRGSISKGATFDLKENWGTL